MRGKISGPTGDPLARPGQARLLPSGLHQLSRRYPEILRVADGGIEKIANSLRPEDVLVVMADHGNDPTIGHPHHTRERVPLLIAHNGAPVGSIGTRKTLSDVGATACEYFDAGKPQNGESFLAKIGVR
ncbi:hypothetical protein [Parafannyhessea sp. LCP21S3_E6]|uniref:hypothetical protein n=1 Tax=unclassified Parafannyhessea TaxID=2847323 RepID=UPI003F9A7317